MLPELLKDRESLFKLKTAIDGKMAAENFTVDVLNNPKQLEALSKQLEALLANESQSAVKAETDAEEKDGGK